MFLAERTFVLVPATVGRVWSAGGGEVLREILPEIRTRTDGRVCELAELHFGLAALETKLIRWMFVFWAGSTLTILGTMAALMRRWGSRHCSSFRALLDTANDEVPCRCHRSRFLAVSGKSFVTSILSLTLVFLASSAVDAQQDPTLERGSVIEIVSDRLPDGIAVGWLVTLTRDSLSFKDSTGTTAVALEDIGQLRVNVGRDAASMNIATVMGVMLGALVGTTTKPEDYECLSSLASEVDCGEEVPSELVGAVIGGGVFRLLARFTLEERWMHVNLDRLIYETEREPK